MIDVLSAHPREYLSCRCRHRHAILGYYDSKHDGYSRQVADGEIDMMKSRKPSEAFQCRLKAARDLRGWSQAELGQRADLPASSIAHFEIGSRKPSFDTLRRLANALDVTTDFLVGRVDDPAVAESADPLFRDVGQLTGRDRELAHDFLKMLADRKGGKTEG